MYNFLRIYFCRMQNRNMAAAGTFSFAVRLMAESKEFFKLDL
jgi:hypothetical protein